MNEERKVKPNYNDPQCTHEYTGERKHYEHIHGEPSYLPANYDYDRNYTESFYEDKESIGAGNFLVGAIVGGIIGAATALFLAPKSGSEMREDFTAQAVQFKAKSIEISTVAKGKATEFTSVAKEKTGEISKSIQEQSGQLVGKVKSMTAKTAIPMDDGTASSEGEEAMEFIEDSVELGEEVVTATAEAIRKAIAGKDDSIGASATEKSSVSEDNSKNA